MALFAGVAHFLWGLVFIGRNIFNLLKLLTKMLQYVALVSFEFSKPCIDSTNLALLSFDRLNACHIELNFAFLFLFTDIILVFSACRIFHELFPHICFVIAASIVS